MLPALFSAESTMRIIKNIVLAVILLVVVLVAIAFALPRKYEVVRSIDIAASADKVFEQINDPRNWAKWTVWNQRDPAMKMDYSGAPSGAGAKWVWQSKSEGTGEMEFTRSEAPKLLAYKLYFPDFDSRSAGQLVLEPAGNSTRLTWSNGGDLGNNPVMRWMGLAMDKMIGSDFDAGLKNLKALVEK
jgi:uncharacterized protein YndB with AHSA1/START domain